MKHTVQEAMLLQEKKVVLQGFVEQTKKMKKMIFVILQDSTGKIQCTALRESNKMLEDKLISLTPGSAVSIQGKVHQNIEVKMGGVELIIDNIEIHSIAHSPLPYKEDVTDGDELLWRQLFWRNPKRRLVLDIQQTLEHALREFWSTNSFNEIHSPKLMATASESGAELFTLEYFGRQATLAQSPQFYKQMAIASGLEKVFEIGPVFRANKSKTNRHDTEFTSIDVEIAWIDSFKDIMKLEEEMLAYALQKVSVKHGEAIREHYGVKLMTPQVPFPKITFKEAKEICKNELANVNFSEDLTPEEEKLVAKNIMETKGHEFVFVTNYPIDVRPFYHMRKNGLTESFDLLWKGLEITTGAQREHRVEILEEQVSDKGIILEEISDYLNFFKYGIPPHGGFGLGLTRILMNLLEVKNIREVTYVYRNPKHLVP